MGSSGGGPSSTGVLSGVDMVTQTELTAAVGTLATATGAVFDGVADAGALLNTYWAGAPTGSVIVMPQGGQLKTTVKLTPKANTTIIWNDCTILSTVAGAAIQMSNGLKMLGRVTINLQSTAGSKGLLYGEGTACALSHVESIIVKNLSATSIGIDRHATAGEFIAYNTIEHSRVVTGVAGSIGERFLDASGGGSAVVNANRTGYASINAVDVPVLVNFADGNGYGYLDVESCSGWAIDLVKCLGFRVNDGWIEGNTAGSLRIAASSDVNHVDISARFDTAMDQADAKFSYTFDLSRDIRVSAATCMRRQLFARKTADETVASSTVLQDDDHLLVALDKNATYEFWGLISYDGDVNGDIKVAFTVPSGATIQWVSTAPNSGSNDSTGASVGMSQKVINASGTAGPIAGAQGSSSGTTRTAVIFRGLIRTGATSGNLVTQWAQGASSVTATTVFTDSFIRAERVA